MTQYTGTDLELGEGGLSFVGTGAGGRALTRVFTGGTTTTGDIDGSDIGTNAANVASPTVLGLSLNATNELTGRDCQVIISDFLWGANMSGEVIFDRVNVHHYGEAGGRNTPRAWVDLTWNDVNFYKNSTNYSVQPGCWVGSGGGSRRPTYSWNNVSFSGTTTNELTGSLSPFGTPISGIDFFGQHGTSFFPGYITDQSFFRGVSLTNGGDLLSGAATACFPQISTRAPQDGTVLGPGYTPLNNRPGSAAVMRLSPQGDNGVDFNRHTHGQAITGLDFRALDQIQGNRNLFTIQTDWGAHGIFINPLIGRPGRTGLTAGDYSVGIFGRIEDAQKGKLLVNSVYFNANNRGGRQQWMIGTNPVFWSDQVPAAERGDIRYTFSQSQVQKRQNQVTRSNNVYVDVTGTSPGQREGGVGNERYSEGGVFVLPTAAWQPRLAWGPTNQSSYSTDAWDEARGFLANSARTLDDPENGFFFRVFDYDSNGSSGGTDSIYKYTNNAHDFPTFNRQQYRAYVWGQQWDSDFITVQPPTEGAPDDVVAEANLSDNIFTSLPDVNTSGEHRWNRVIRTENAQGDLTGYWTGKISWNGTDHVRAWERWGNPDGSLVTGLVDVATARTMGYDNYTSQGWTTSTIHTRPDDAIVRQEVGTTRPYVTVAAATAETANITRGSDLYVRILLEAWNRITDANVGNSNTAIDPRLTLTGTQLRVDNSSGAAGGVVFTSGVPTIPSTNNTLPIGNITSLTRDDFIAEVNAFNMSLDRAITSTVALTGGGFTLTGMGDDSNRNLDFLQYDLGTRAETLTNYTFNGGTVRGSGVVGLDVGVVFRNLTIDGNDTVTINYNNSVADTARNINELFTGTLTRTGTGSINIQRTGDQQLRVDFPVGTDISDLQNVEFGGMRFRQGNGVTFAIEVVDMFRAATAPALAQFTGVGPVWRLYSLTAAQVTAGNQIGTLVATSSANANYRDANGTMNLHGNLDTNLAALPNAGTLWPGELVTDLGTDDVRSLYLVSGNGRTNLIRHTARFVDDETASYVYEAGPRSPTDTTNVPVGYDGPAATVRQATVAYSPDNNVPATSSIPSAHTIAYSNVANGSMTVTLAGHSLAVDGEFRAKPIQTRAELAAIRTSAQYIEVCAENFLVQHEADAANHRTLPTILSTTTTAQVNYEPLVWIANGVLFLGTRDTGAPIRLEGGASNEGYENMFRVRDDGFNTFPPTRVDDNTGITYTPEDEAASAMLGIINDDSNSNPSIEVTVVATAAGTSEISDAVVAATAPRVASIVSGSIGNTVDADGNRTGPAVLPILHTKS